MQFDRVVCDSTKRITGAYGWITLPDGTPYNHKGIDLGWRTDEEQNKVFANCYGVVAYTEDGLGRGEGASGWGNYVLIKHPNGMYSRYAHLQKGLWVSVGQEVNENTVLGIMGDSGNVTARHLHFEVQTSASCYDRIDPTPYLSMPIWSKSPEPTTDKYYQVVGGSLLLLNDSYASIGSYPTGTIVKYIRDGYNLNYQGRTYHYYYVEVTTDGKQGYMAQDYLQPYNQPTPQPTPDIQVGTRVKTIGMGKSSCYGDTPNAMSGLQGVVGDIQNGTPYPYRVDDNDGALGWYKKEDLQIL